MEEKFEMCHRTLRVLAKQMRRMFWLMLGPGVEPWAFTYDPALHMVSGEARPPHSDSLFMKVVNGIILIKRD